MVSKAVLEVVSVGLRGAVVCDVSIPVLIACLVRGARPAQGLLITCPHPRIGLGSGWATMAGGLLLEDRAVQTAALRPHCILGLR